MAGDVDGIASRLGPSVEQVTFQFDATKRVQMTVWTLDHVIEQNGVEFSSCPLALNLVRNQQFFRKIGSNPLGQLRRNPSQDRVSSTEPTRHPCRLWVQDTIVNGSIMTPSQSAGGKAHPGSGRNLACFSK